MLVGVYNVKNTASTTIDFGFWLAPEIINSKQYGYSVDWYSLGLVIYEMICGHNPFKTGQKMSFME